MRFALCCALVCVGAAAAAAAVPPELEPLAFLIGDWEAGGGGAPGSSQGIDSFTRGLQDRVILRSSFTEFPATAEKAAFRHDDLTIIYVDEGGAVRAEYFDNEGHIIRYTETVAAPDRVSFTSAAQPGAPRFRLSYNLASDGVLHGEFAMAPPGQPDSFAPYLSWESRRVAPSE